MDLVGLKPILRNTTSFSALTQVGWVIWSAKTVPEMTYNVFNGTLNPTHFTSDACLPKSCNQCRQLGAVGGMVQGKRSGERCRSWTVLHAQWTTALFSGFSLSQDNAEALDRWGGKTKHHLISYFLSNTSAKEYRNRIVCVKIIASQRWGGTSLRHSV